MHIVHISAFALYTGDSAYGEMSCDSIHFQELGSRQVKAIPYSILTFWVLKVGIIFNLQEFTRK